MSLTIILLAISLLAQGVSGQEGGAETVVEMPTIPEDKYDRGTPKRSAAGFAAAIDRADYRRAAEYLDLRNLQGRANDYDGAHLARRFSVVARRATWTDVDELIDHPAGRSGDELPSYRDSLGTLLEDGGEVQLFMQRVPRGDGVFIWKLSNATVSLIPRLYETYGYPEFIENLRRKLPSISFLGYELFKWVILLVVGVSVYLTMLLIALATRHWLLDGNSSEARRIFRFMAVPLTLWSVIILVNVTAHSLGQGPTAEALRRLTPLPILLTVWVLFAALNLVRDVKAERLARRDRPGAALMMRPATNALKLLVAVGAALVYLDQLGINITTVLAGLGVGGVAVALALQKPLEDVFGAITLYTQQPVRVGDFCRVDSETGTIEEIGLRTTRIRTLANTLVAIPNAHLANQAIDNISARKKILYNPILRLSVDTCADQMERIQRDVFDLLRNSERIVQDGYRVRFKEFAEDALLVEVYAHIDTTDWADYLAAAEELNIKILKILERAGAVLAVHIRQLHTPV